MLFPVDAVMCRGVCVACYGPLSMRVCNVDAVMCRGVCVGCYDPLAI